MPDVHRISWTINKHSGPVADLECLGGPGDPCHKSCARDDCVEGCNCGDPQLETHPYCVPVEWIVNNDGYEGEYYTGPDDVPLHDGPITLTWDGTDYTWDYTGGTDG